MKKYNRVMEYFWLAICLISILAVAYLMVRDGFMQAVQLLVFPALAGLMYGLRVAFRKRLKKYEQQKQ